MHETSHPCPAQAVVSWRVALTQETEPVGQPPLTRSTRKWKQRQQKRDKHERSSGILAYRAMASLPNSHPSVFAFDAEPQLFFDPRRRTGSRH
jgi:hypothetical protein